MYSRHNPQQKRAYIEVVIFFTGGKVSAMPLVQARLTSSWACLLLLLVLPTIAISYVCNRIVWLLYPLALYAITSFLLFIECEAIAFDSIHQSPDTLHLAIHNLPISLRRACHIIFNSITLIHALIRS
ncbi:hypothetical protein KP509_12G067500 [Ceratopteris richardii]|uniref:Uncharacterized protein n=1 Tax=Ceratopteris richardii TaxID=49495 RepID=A0A8T2TMF0_CERRI|nr:hypothetical protein KP509_12G067500 [Ceratopteris richardii]